MLHGVVVRSPHAHARFRIVDIAAARALKGVRLVLTAADITHLGSIPCLGAMGNDDKSKAPKPAYPVLCADTVRHVGDAVAFVVAESQNIARDAAEMIEIEWEPLPAVADPRVALEKGAPQVWPEAPGTGPLTLRWARPRRPRRRSRARTRSSGSRSRTTGS